MKYVVLGASGETGNQIVKQALEKGHDVTAVARNPHKINLGHAQLQVVRGNVFSADSLAQYFSGTDVVISALGHRWTSFFTTVNIYSRSIKAICEAMRKTNTQRLIVMSAWCTSGDNSEAPKIPEWVLSGGRIHRDMAAMEEFLTKECADIQYTIVKVPRLQNGAYSGKEFLTTEGQFHPGAAKAISRMDAAKYILDIADSGAQTGKCIALGITR